MTNVTARIKKAGKHFEILVDLEQAMKFRKGESNFIQAETEIIFRDSKKGERAPSSDLELAFGTTDVDAIVKVIVKDGEIQTTQDFRDAEQEKRFKQVIDFLSRNSVDPRTGHPHSPDRIKNALDQAHVNIKNVPIENQIKEIIDHLSAILPIKIETKRIKTTIPAIHTGKAYGVISQYEKTDENWLSDGSLEVVMSIPAGMIMDFYDKLNSVTHGSALTQEIKE
jgi:ribosome maturation protein SDO1